MTAKTKRPTEDRANRTRRSFVGDTADVLTVKGKDPDFEYRWVNDERGRVQRMIEAGYDVVLDEHLIGDGTAKDAGSANTITVDRKHGVKGVLMRIPKDWAEEDKRARASQIAESEAELFKDEREADGRYGTLTKE